MTPLASMSIVRPRLAFLTTRADGGAFGQVALGLESGFRSLGIPFDVVRLRAPAEVERDHGNVRRISLGQERASRVLIRLTRYLRSTQPEALLVSPGHLAPFALAAGRVTGVPVFPWEVTFLDRDFADLPPRMRVLLMAQGVSYRAAAGVPCVSRAVLETTSRRLARHVPIDKYFIVPNPIDVSRLENLAVGEDVVPTSRFRFCAVGRLAEQKGYDVLLRAFAQTGAELGEWELVVLGQGPRRSELVELTHALGLQGRVRFLGHLANPYPLMARSDAFVHPARWEGFGLVVAEALALGVPVVATRCPGAPAELLDDGGLGLLVPPDDAAELAAALIRIRHDPALRDDLSARGRERVSDFAPENVAASLLDQIQPFLPHRRSAV